MSQNILSFDLSPTTYKCKTPGSPSRKPQLPVGSARPPRTRQPPPRPQGSPATGTENTLCLLFLIRSFSKYFVGSPHCAGGTRGERSERLRAAAFGAAVPSPGNLQSLPQRFFPPGWGVTGDSGAGPPRPPPAAQPSDLQSHSSLPAATAAESSSRRDVWQFCKLVLLLPSCLQHPAFLVTGI